MFFIPFYLQLFYHVGANDNETSNVDIHDNFFGLANLLYGDVTKLDDMFLPPLDSEQSETDNSQDERELANRKAAFFKLEEFDILKPIVLTPDVAEFNDITRVFQNETRRYMGPWHGWTDHEDSELAWWIFGTYAISRDYEDEKKNRMTNMQLQWIVHTRVLIKKALELKRDVRSDKRYKIGYLMSRLRIIKYEQQKITSFAQALERNYFRGLKALLKFYERMVRYDVDIKDTVKFIKELNKEKIPSLVTQPESTLP